MGRSVEAAGEDEEGPDSTWGSGIGIWDFGENVRILGWACRLVSRLG